MSFMSRIVSQFKRPHGFGGHVACWVMGHRPSNRKRNSWTVDLLRKLPLLTGIIKCAQRKSHMLGGGGYKKGIHVRYYVCPKRYNDHECEQDYVRAELLESAIIEYLERVLAHSPNPPKSTFSASW